MRAGDYAVVDGVEYQAKVHGDMVTLFLPRTQPCPQGWVRSQGDRWKMRIPRTNVSELYTVGSYANFEGIYVSVRQVFPATKTAWIYYIGGSEEQPMHPVFQPDPDPGIAWWNATVPWDSLTDVVEPVTPIR